MPLYETISRWAVLIVVLIIVLANSISAVDAAILLALTFLVAFHHREG